MPVLKHAQKKLRQDKGRTLQNKKLKDLYKKLVKNARVAKTAKAIDEAVSVVDKAAKNNIIHKNKAARLKSSLAKAAPKREAKAAAKKTTSAKPAAKKPAVKKAAAKKPAASTKGGSSSGRKKSPKKS